MNINMEQNDSMDIEDSPVFVTQPHDHDVLCGRGGKANNHPGNVRFRDRVRQKKPTYVAVPFKREKGLISEGIVNEIKRLDPPGRFLIYDGKAKQWVEISERKARRKTAQALREKAPADRKKLSDARVKAGKEARSAGGNRSPWQNSMENVMGKLSSAFNCCGNNTDAKHHVEPCPPLTKSYDFSSGDPLPAPLVTPSKPDILGYSFGDASRSVATEDSTLISSMQDSVDTDGMYGTCDMSDNSTCSHDCIDELLRDVDDTKPATSVNEYELMRSEIITPPNRNMNGEICHGLDDFFALKEENNFEPFFDFDMNDDALQADTVSSTNFKSG